MIFAAAPSQNEFLAALRETENLDWQRVTAFHMDEYVGLRDDAPQSFRRFLKDHLFDVVQPGLVHYLDGDAPDPEEECRRYTELLTEHPLAIVCAGIGENGHLAFNDPHIADFEDPLLVKVVALDLASRQQQVNDGCFERLEDVPTHALTVSIPALTNARYLSVVVPGAAKAEAGRGDAARTHLANLSGDDSATASGGRLADRWRRSGAARPRRNWGRTV